MHPNVRRFGGGIRERDRAIERLARFIIAAELQQQAALYAEEMKITSIDLSRAARSFRARPAAPVSFDTATARLRVMTGDGWSCSRIL